MKQDKITQSAKGENCTIRLNVCNHNPETTVYCHISGVRFGHGVGIKPRFGAYGCSSCHDAIDGRVKTSYSPTELKTAHYEGVLETILRLIDKNLITF